MLFVLLAISAVLAVVTTGFFMPQLETLRIAGEQKTVEFQTLHGRANALFMARTVALLIAGLLLPAVVQMPRREAVNSAKS